MVHLLHRFYGVDAPVYRNHQEKKNYKKLQKYKSYFVFNLPLLYHGGFIIVLICSSASQHTLLPRSVEQQQKVKLLFIFN